MIFFQHFFLDREKDIAVDLWMEGERMEFVIRTPNHHTGNLITNLAALCDLPVSLDAEGLKVIRGEVPCYFDGDNRRIYIFRLGNTKIANISPEGNVELKASIPAISKTLMSQTKEYHLTIDKTIVKSYIRRECKFRSDLHTHMNGNLPPDVLIALGVIHQIRYPYYYIRKLGLKCSPEQRAALERDRAVAETKMADSPLTGKYRERRIDDMVFLNFAELILGNPEDAAFNIGRVRNSLTIPKDGQAVFADLEKVYLYRYVFTKGLPAEKRFPGIPAESIPDRDVRWCAERMLRDRETPVYCRNTLFQDGLLWIAREYQRHGITYVEITDTALLKPEEAPERLRQIHEIMPAVTRETGVHLRFLAGIRRVPLTIIRDQVTPNDYLTENLRCLRAIAADPYVAGRDIIGEEINDILELRSLIQELTRIADENPGFVIRIHAGENDSLRDNVANAIRCVTEALRPGQPMPRLRLGHGLYTCDLRSARGRRLLEEMRERDVTLEFQITSNVRLNNLSSMGRHPLRQYLRAGVRCVQGTDGGALYGTNSIDEELSLEKLLGLSLEELCRMRQGEEELIAESLAVFERKTEAFQSAFPGGDLARYYAERMMTGTAPARALWKGKERLSVEKKLKDRVSGLPEGLFPIVVAGGSFSARERRASLRPEDIDFIDRLLAGADPEKTCFVVGHTLSGQEGELVRKARDRFRIIAVVPNQLSRTRMDRLERAEVGILISNDSTGNGLYQTFGEEIFSRTPSMLLVFEGNSTVMNLIQEARNGQKKCWICLNPRSRNLTEKARTLQGYVSPLAEPEELLRRHHLMRESEVS